MDAKTRQFVRDRAGNVCEYCRIPQESVPLVTFHVEHTIAKQHGGTDDPNFLCLACDRCNAFKGPNLSSIDPKSGELVRLFSPREDAWSDHFRFNGGEIIGLTAIGRATARLLNMNAIRRVQLREEWLDEGGEL